MAYFEDLQPCTAFPGEWRNLLAIGWLSKDHDFKKANVDHELLRALAQLRSWMPPQAPQGSHRCDLCGAEAPVREESGAHFIPGQDVLYVAPRMISHYIRDHGYSPPREFVTAVHARLDSADATFGSAIERHFARQLGPPMVLEGIESVRIRPGMYIGDTFARGLEHMLFELIGNSLDQHLAGRVTRLSVEIEQTGTVTLEDDGPGIPVHVLPEHGRPFIELVFTTLHSGPTFDNHYPHVHARSGLIGVGAGPVSALCTRLEVESRHGGRRFRAAFELGRTVEPVAELGMATKPGTWLRYRPDETIFAPGVVHDLGAIEHRLRNLAGLCPRLELHFQGRSLQRPEGLRGWLREAPWWWDRLHEAIG